MAEPTLENLPTELKILILFRVPDHDTLKSLVLASPKYHHAYLAVRQELLEYLVHQQYSGFLDLAEALTVVRSQGLYFSSYKESAISLLDCWRRRNETHSLGQALRKPDGLEEVIKLLHFHKLLSFFLEDYSINAPRPPWIQLAQWKNEYLPLGFSPLETRRFLRALCRFQLLHNIFGDQIECEHDYDEIPNCDKHPDCDKHGVRPIWQLGEFNGRRGPSRMNNTWLCGLEAYRLFYGIMPPWEYEEMGCVFGYLVSKIKPISKEIADDLRQLIKNTPCEFFCDIIPREQRPPVCEIEIESDLDHFNKHFKGLAGLGPEFLYRVLHMDRLSRRNTVCNNTRGFWPGPFIGLQMGLSWDKRFPFIDPMDRLEFSQNFEQFWSALSPLEQPSVGWKKAWLVPHNEGDSFEDSLNYNRAHEKDWEWCYALWDERRLQEWRAPLLEDGV
ncbi:uncharacterized protein N7459_007600 [Penicillium hispanicum]|uniref:uncharacterized protein n=1 Tax=Penicillium hispanicum TaxID=1080232 RepID=UPI002541F310|nr:uncharacterized protein N7459_007600 [Penicillium hispanicum]KAJ5578636.1 hypothetical protein N7459_007600 [Penicillium hispanicum]